MTFTAHRLRRKYQDHDHRHHPARPMDAPPERPLQQRPRQHHHPDHCWAGDSTFAARVASLTSTDEVTSQDSRYSAMFMILNNGGSSGTVGQRVTVAVVFSVTFATPRTGTSASPVHCFAAKAQHYLTRSLRPAI